MTPADDLDRLFKDNDVYTIRDFVRIYNIGHKNTVHGWVNEGVSVTHIKTICGKKVKDTQYVRLIALPGRGERRFLGFRIKEFLRLINDKYIS